MKNSILLLGVFLVLGLTTAYGQEKKGPKPQKAISETTKENASGAKEVKGKKGPKPQKAISESTKENATGTKSTKGKKGPKPEKAINETNKENSTGVKTKKKVIKKKKD